MRLSQDRSQLLGCGGELVQCCRRRPPGLSGSVFSKSSAGRLKHLPIQLQGDALTPLIVIHPCQHNLIQLLCWCRRLSNCCSCRMGSSKVVLQPGRAAPAESATVEQACSCMQAPQLQPTSMGQCMRLRPSPQHEHMPTCWLSCRMMLSLVSLRWCMTRPSTSRPRSTWAPSRPISVSLRFSAACTASTVMKHDKWRQDAPS